MNDNASPCRNILLNSLSRADYAYIRPRLERVPLSDGHVIVAQGEAISFVSFPDCGVTSVAEVLEDGAKIEVALIGREGMTNSQLLLGCDRAPNETTMQTGGGTTLRLGAEELRKLCARSHSAHSLFLRFIHALAVQTTHTLVSYVRDPVEPRLARWLLMCHDRIEGDAMHFTHQQVAGKLGVRRATVTDTLHLLEGRGAVWSKRGQVIVRDRRSLEEAAGKSYGFAERHYRRSIATFGKQPSGQATVSKLRPPGASATPRVHSCLPAAALTSAA